MATDGHNGEHESRVNAILAAYFEAVEAGQPEDPQALLSRHPDLAAELAAFFAEQEQLARLAAPLRSMVAVGPSTPGPDRTLPADRDTPAPGSAFGDYELLEEIGQGGMGVVYRTRQRSLNR